MGPLLPGEKWRVDCADAGECLCGLPDGYAQTLVTSPPYFGLRDYGVAGQVGLESSPEAFIEKLVGMFRASRRVLHPTGTLWVNMGDSYANDAKGPGDNGKSTMTGGQDHQRIGSPARLPKKWRADGIKKKDRLGIPHMLAFALRADGWYWRDEIVWHKKSPMTESVLDRCTKAHEFLFMFSLSPRYFWDQTAVAERAVMKPQRRPAGRDMGYLGMPHNGKVPARGEAEQDYLDRNPRSVWSLATEPYEGAHFATFPTKLVEPCVLAGTSARGCCPRCRAPWGRVVKRQKVRRDRPNDYTKRTGQNGTGNSCANSVAGVATETTGWRASCECEAGDPVPCVVLDCFAGSGTTGVVSLRHGRRFHGADLNPAYCALARKRIGNETPALGLAW